MTIFGRKPRMTAFSECVATLQGIDMDLLSVLRYFSGPNCIKEDGHAGAGRVPTGSYRRNHSC